MISSRRVEDLVQDMQIKCRLHCARCEDEIKGVHIIVCCTLRDAEAQHVLFMKGREQQEDGTWKVTNHLKVVTDADSGMSFHQYGVAYDVFPLHFGKPLLSVEGDEGIIWQKIVDIGEQCGLESASKWKHFPEWPHFQDAHGFTIEQFKEAGSLQALIDRRVQ